MTQESPVRVRITSETHEHEDKPVKKGTVLEVHPATATHLVKLGAAEFVGAPPATASATAGGE